MEGMNGVIVLDKPGGCSSHDAVQRMRRLARTKRVGHLGTLDPLATGVLPLVIGKATRLSKFFLGHDREYEAAVRLGFATSTYDRDGDAVSEPASVDVGLEDLENALSRYLGTISQRPPAVSAKKIAGVPAYKRVRRQEKVELDPVEVTIYELELLSFCGDEFRIRLRTSAGAYVRSLAHDLGQGLGCGGHISELRRTSMGQFSVENARTFEQLEEMRDEGSLEEALVPPEQLLPEIPVCRVDAVTAGRIAHGQEFHVSAFSRFATAERVKAVGPDGELLAIGELKLPGAYHPAIVF